MSAATLTPNALADVLPGSVVRRFTAADLAELFVLQRCCWVSEAQANDSMNIPPLRESAEQVLAGSLAALTLVVRIGPRPDGRLVASVRGEERGRRQHIGRLMVAPDLAGRGIGTALLALIESLTSTDVDEHLLFTGTGSHRNIALYQRCGYSLLDDTDPDHITGTVTLGKARNPR